MPDHVEHEMELATAFADVARQLQCQDNPQETWQRLVELANELVPAFEHAAVSLVHGGERVETVAATDDVPRIVDRIQYETGEGPCLSAIREEEMFLVQDLSAETRWPAFIERVVKETGVAAMVSYRLFVQEETLGALNIYSHETDAFDERAQALGCVLAAHAAVAMSAAQDQQHAEQLEEALESSREIGTAVGILMVQTKVDRDRAFQALAEGSMRMNIKLRDLARRMVLAEEENNRAKRDA